MSDSANRAVRQWIWVGVACGVVGSAAFVVGGRFATIEVAETPTVEAPVVVEAQVPDLSEDFTLATAANRRLLNRIAQLEKLLAAKAEGDEGAVVVRPGDVEGDLAGEGEPLMFKSNLAYEYTPDGFEKVANQMVRECGLGLELITIDCGEYPCMAWTRSSDLEGRRFSMSGCAPWEDAFPNGTTVIGTAERVAEKGEGERFFAWMAVPENPDDLRQAWRRAQVRAEEMKVALGLD